MHNARPDPFRSSPVAGAEAQLAEPPLHRAETITGPVVHGLEVVLFVDDPSLVATRARLVWRIDARLLATGRSGPEHRLVLVDGHQVGVHAELDAEIVLLPATTLLEARQRPGVAREPADAGVGPHAETAVVGTGDGILAEGLIPIMLLTLGLQLAATTQLRLDADVVAATGLRLIAAPVIAAVAAALAGLNGDAAGVTIVMSAMPAAVFAGIVAIEHDLEPEMVTTTVLVSTIASVASAMVCASSGASACSSPVLASSFSFVVMKGL